MGVNKVNYGAKTVIDLSKDTVTASKLLKGVTAHDKNGDQITGTYEVGTSGGGTDTSDATAVASNILEEKTAYIARGKVTGTMMNRGATAGTISKKTGAYIIPEGYHNGDGSVSIAEAERDKIIPENIKNGITLLGVSGTYTGDGSGSTEVDKTGKGEYLWAIYDTKEKWDYTVKSISGTTKPSGYSSSQYNTHEITDDGYWKLGTKTGGTTSSDYYYLPENVQNGKAKSILKKSAYSYTNPYSVLTIKDTADSVQGDNLLGYISADTKDIYPEKGIQDGKYYIRVAGADANVTANRMLSGSAGYTNDGKVTGTIKSQTAQTITPVTEDQTIASGVYLSGAQTIKGDANLLAENIKSGISIFGVTGTYESSGSSGEKNVAQGTITGAGTNAVTIDTGLNSINIFALFNHSSASASGITSVLYLNGTVTGVGVSYSQYFKTVGYSAGKITIDGGKVTYTPKEDTAITALMQDKEYTWIAIE